jgi:hypothetical protein
MQAAPDFATSSFSPKTVNSKSLRVPDITQDNRNSTFYWGIDQLVY